MARLFRPVDIASLAVFRVCLGLLLFWDVVYYFRHDGIRAKYVDPTFFFAYPGFGWLEPLPADAMFALFAALGVLALCIAAGLAYRAATAAFFVGFTYLFLLDASTYLNHFYLISLVCLLMIFVPAHGAASLDARLRPALRSPSAPAWSLWLLRFQIGVVYVYGGIAKLNGDWLRGEPLGSWLPLRARGTALEPLLSHEWMGLVFSHGGLLLDLLIVPALLHRRTRPFALAAGILFHCTNAWLFHIGIFPWVMIAATLLFLPPDWPRRCGRRLGIASFPSPPAPSLAAPGLARQRGVGILLGVWVAVQLLAPLRHFAYPGDVAWTEEGHRFSWRMKLRSKRGRVSVIARNPETGASWSVDASEFLTSSQRFKMSTRPDLIQQLARHVAEHEAEKRGLERVEVRVLARAALNGRPYRLLIDPTVDLAAQPSRLLPPAPWILPLAEPGRGRSQLVSRR